MDDRIDLNGPLSFQLKKDTHHEAQRSWNFRTHTKDKEKRIKASRERNNFTFYDQESEALDIITEISRRKWFNFWGKILNIIAKLQI